MRNCSALSRQECTGGIWCKNGKYPQCSGANCTYAEIPGYAAANAGTACGTANSWKKEPNMPGPRVACGMVEAPLERLLAEGGDGGSDQKN